jgi:replicative DNA helicase
MPLDEPASGQGAFGWSLLQPPANLQAEQALLGALLARNQALERVPFLKPEHFADPGHGAIFAAIQRRVAEGGVADVISLRPVFENDPQFGTEEGGGAAYLATLLGAMVGVLNAGEYGRVILDCYLRRQLIDIAKTITAQAYAPDPETLAEAQIEQARALLDQVATHSEQPERLVMLQEAMGEAIERGNAAAARAGSLAGISTGFRSLDRITGGLEPGWLVVLGGRPGMGKSGLALQIAMRAAAGLRPIYDVEDVAFERGEPMPALFISLEMQAYQLARRALSLASGVSLEALRFGAYTRDPQLAEAVVVGQRTLEGVPLAIEDTPALRLGAIDLRIRAAKRRFNGKLGLVVLDHLHIAGREDTAGPSNETVAVGALTKGLKRLAKAHDVPILALAQMNRGVEARDNKRPTMADLRASGNIEEDADVVAFVYRESYYLRDAPERTAFKSAEDHAKALALHEARLREATGRAEVIFAKGRDFQTTTATLGFQADKVRFHELGE